MSSVLLWKEEPVSPASYADEVSLLDTTFYQTNFDIYDDVKLEAELAACESKAEVASHILENLENLMDLDDLIKDEPFLLDEKMLPILEEVEPPRAVPVSLRDIKSEYVNKTPHTEYLLNEFETMYDVVELTHNTLTPPQSPPTGQPMLTNLEPLLVTVYPDDKPAMYHVPEKQLLHDSFASMPIEQNIIYPELLSPTNSPSQPDIAHELAVVDELIRTRVEDMQWSSSSSSSASNPGSPGDSSNFGDCSSDDPEWVPETVEVTAESPGKTPRKRRSYAKSAPEEKKVRKKEQNKNAATRYRLKKKAEVEVILSEEKVLLQHHNELESQITDLQREIKYLKGLMRDLFKAKGIIN